MQLFAIIAHVDEGENFDENQTLRSSKSVRIIESFLRSEISAQLVEQYLDLFTDYLNTIHQKQSKKDGEKKRTSVNSVKVLRICSQINEELTQRQKIIVLIRIIEFIQSNDVVTDQENEFVNTVADAFNIDTVEYDLISYFILGKRGDISTNDAIIHVSNNSELQDDSNIFLEGLNHEIRILHIKSVNLLFFRYFGNDEVSLNGQFVPNHRTHIYTQGSTLKTTKSKSLYYSDVLSHFLKSSHSTKLNFKLENLSYKFKTGQMGLQPIDLDVESGNLIGIMGGSGAGKSTLLNILNGNLDPSHGRVLINGIDLHKERNKLQGIIGFVSQDDLLIDELTVYQNLFFNAKLCFGTLSDREIQRRVIAVLHSIGLYESKDLVVGNPMQKIISGGQRKRLNIALELIREPDILFVDEPTSGLSSRDSENIMDLLKELTFKGKLIFVVIHQPSSDIFKQFDKLLIIDRGGFPVFDGNPIDAVVYFKGHFHHGNAEERECSVCGNVNPELIFNILESKIVDEYGNQTSHRKTTPEEWYSKYKETLTIEEHDQVSELPSSPTKVAGIFRQFRVFFTRDLLAKLSNRQYIIVTLIQAPLLALLMAFVVKYYEEGKSYDFSENISIPQYIFIAVVVSLFLGLTVAAEEIFKDKKILKRESFLNLSRGSYLISKVLILFIISALQSALFVTVGNLILEIKGMWLEYWLILFSTSCLANVMGLNISSAFDSAKVIYIIVPILIIPQLLFSGVIVKFDKLHPAFSKQVGVPFIGNMMPSRWAYEAIAVAQAMDNKFNKQFYALELEKNTAAWKKDYWMVEMKNQLDVLMNSSNKKEDRVKAKTILINEIALEEQKWDNLTCENCAKEIEESNLGKKKIDRINFDGFLSTINAQETKNYTDAVDKIDQLKKKLGTKEYQQLKKDYSNEALNDMVTNRLEANKHCIGEESILRKDAPMYYIDKNIGYFDAPFYASYKFLYNQKIPTFYANLLMIWGFITMTYILLYFDVLRKILEFNKSIFSKNGQ
ncbi:MAG: ATP-binding cassette domain-containing protein [Bacteroidota bacterium]